MAAVQSPPHEIARQEKLAHLAAVDAREELQRRHAQNAADTGADAEREARVAAFGEAPQASPLVKAISAGELEQKATTQQVKALAEEERKARIEADAERERASESERRSKRATERRDVRGFSTFTNGADSSPFISARASARGALPARPGRSYAYPRRKGFFQWRAVRVIVRAVQTLSTC